MSPAALATLQRNHHHHHATATATTSTSTTSANSHHHKSHQQHHYHPPPPPPPHHHHHHQPLKGKHTTTTNNNNHHHHHHHRSSRTKCVGGDVVVDEKQEKEDDSRKRSLADLVAPASAELERLRSTTNVTPSVNNNNKNTTSSSLCMTTTTTTTFPSFPSACLHLLQHIDGNHRCMDCGDLHPEWAAVSYGALLCLQCSGHHRSLGVHVSCVRSIFMDAWSLEQVIAMLEGGNRQLAQFFARHALCVESIRKTSTTSTGSAALSSSSRSTSPTSSTLTPDNVTRLRYKTKAALFYRQQLALHCQRVLAAGPYRGREQSRAAKPAQNQKAPATATATPSVPHLLTLDQKDDNHHVAITITTAISTTNKDEEC